MEIADEVACWLKDAALLRTMSHRAKASGRPNAAADIVLDIGATSLSWMKVNEVALSASSEISA